MYMESTCLELATRLNELDKDDPRRSELLAERRQVTREMMEVSNVHVTQGFSQ
jgi:hypothetical protein